MHMLSKEDLSSGKLATRRRSRNAITVVTANGEVRTNEEAQVYVHDLYPLVTVQLFEDTPAVLSLKDGSNILCKTENHVTLVVPGLSSSSSASSSSTSPPQDSLTSLNPANSRSNEGAPGNCRVEALETAARSFPNGWRTSQKTSIS